MTKAVDGLVEALNACGWAGKQPCDLCGFCGSTLADCEGTTWSCRGKVARAALEAFAQETRERGDDEER